MGHQILWKPQFPKNGWHKLFAIAILVALFLAISYVFYRGCTVARPWEPGKGAPALPN